MDSIKPSQAIQRNIKLVFVILLVGAVYLLYANKSITTTNILLTTPEEVTAVANHPSYQHIQGVLDLHHWTLDNGAKVFFVPTPHLPMVDIDLTFNAGAAQNPKGKGGLAYLTNNLFLEGSGSLDADQLAVKLDELGVEFHTESHRDMATLHMRSLTGDVLSRSVDLFSLILHKPLFPQEALAREINNTQVALKNEQQQPNKVAIRSFFETLYADTPYENWRLGSEEELNHIQLSDIKSFYQQFYTAPNAVVALVGDIDLEMANQIANKLTAKLPAGKVAQKLSVAAALKEPFEQSIAFDSEQTHIVIGGLGIARGDQDYYPLYVGNHILGGGSLTSRIFDIVRNQNGLAYSVYSYFLPMQAQGPFMMNCQTRGDQALKAQELMINTLQDFMTKGPTAEELTLAKKNLIGGYALDFDSNYSISRQISSLGFYGLPLETFNQYKEKVESVTAKDIRKAFAKHLAADKLIVLHVGGKA